MTKPLNREATMEQRYLQLHKAVTKLYFAAHWSPDRECDAEKIWTDLRNAAGFAPGYSTEVLGPPRKLTRTLKPVDYSWKITRAYCS